MCQRDTVLGDSVSSVFLVCRLGILMIYHVSACAALAFGLCFWVHAQKKRIGGKSKCADVVPRTLPTRCHDLFALFVEISRSNDPFTWPGQQNHQTMMSIESNQND